MPELGKGVILGGGFAGFAAAYWFREYNTETPLVILEKTGGPLSWLDGKGMDSILAGSECGGGEPLIGRYLRGLPEIQRVMDAWPGETNLNWLESLGFKLKRDSTGMVSFAEGTDIRKKWSSILQDRNVELKTNYAVESLSPQPDSTIRIWSRDGDSTEARGLLFATGGERNHGLTLARELGHETSPVEAGYLRLRLASPKLGSLLGPLTRNVNLKCLKSGEEASGSLSLTGRGLEGMAVSCLSARLGTVWRQLGHRLKIEVDWFPHRSHAKVIEEISDRSQRGGRQAIGDEPLFGFTIQQWSYFLKQAKLDGQISWGKVNPRKLQALALQLKRSRLLTSGSGLPSGERSWAGGIQSDSIDWSRGKSTVMKRVWMAGEVMDFLGMPGGPHMNAVWASAYQAGCSMGMALKNASKS